MWRNVFSILAGWGAWVVALAGILFAGWTLHLAGLHHGRWDCCTMFFPAVVLLLCQFFIWRYGGETGTATSLAGLLIIFGFVVLVTG